jgi:hypothetical protein
MASRKDNFTFLMRFSDSTHDQEEPQLHYNYAGVFGSPTHVNVVAAK